MSYTADGGIRGAVDRLIDMLGRCDAMTSLVADWPTRIYLDALPPRTGGGEYSRNELESLRPFAIVWPDDVDGLRLRRRTAGIGCPSTAGRIIAQIEIPTPSNLAADPTALGRHVQRLMGRVAHTGSLAAPGLWDLSHASGSLPIDEIDVTGYHRTDPRQMNDVGDCLVFELAVRWGVA